MMAILITQTHEWKLLQLRLRSDVRSSTYHLYPQVLHLWVARIRVWVIAAKMIRKTWNIFQNIYFSLGGRSGEGGGKETKQLWRKTIKVKKDFTQPFFFFNFVISYGQFHFVIGHPTVKKVQRTHKVKASSLSFFPAWCNSLSSVLCALSLLLSNVAGTLMNITQEHLSCNYACAWRGQSCIKKIEICCYPLLFSTLVEWSPKPWECWKFWRSTVLAARHHKHQRNNLMPVIIKMWKEEQDKLVERLSNIGGDVVLFGDGRSDSPGHSAKYGAFTFIEQRINKDV